MHLHNAQHKGVYDRHTLARLPSHASSPPGFRLGLPSPIDNTLGSILGSPCFGKLPDMASTKCRSSSSSSAACYCYGPHGFRPFLRQQPGPYALKLESFAVGFTVGFEPQRLETRPECVSLVSG